MLKRPVQAIIRPILVIGVFFTLFSPAKAQNLENGKSLYESQCVACHAIDKKSIGPALKGVDQRKDEAWLIKWIRNSQELVKAGDPYAVQIFNEYNKMVMTPFESLTDDDIKDILAYVKAEENKAAAPVEASTGGTAAPAGAQAVAAESGSGMNQVNIVLIVLAVILLVSGLLLYRINGYLKELISRKFPEKAADMEPSWYNSKFTPWLRSLNPTIASLVVITLFMAAFGGWFFTYANSEIGVQQGYAPTQPINFSHKLHAGDMAIDCKYCHSTVEVSKQASVPSVSTCMNCHSYIDASDKYNGEVSPEIQKIRTAYETNTPIKWIRIHNLPDLAYFNHAQHVSVGKVECQTCHGPIETMEKVSQHASLQMGWCVNCHRESEVDVANNDYYEQLHADLEKRGKRTITVAHNGGLDCGKCHY